METVSPNTDNHTDVKSWRGYTIDELRFRRAYMLARCEISKVRFLEASESMRQGLPAVGIGRGLVGKFLRSLNYVDYLLIAYRVGSKIFKYTRRR